MLKDIIATIISAPIKIVNIPIKAAEATLKASIGEKVEYEYNSLDNIASVIKESVKELFQ